MEALCVALMLSRNGARVGARLYLMRCAFWKLKFAPPVFVSLFGARFWPSSSMGLRNAFLRAFIPPLSPWNTSVHWPRRCNRLLRSASGPLCGRRVPFQHSFACEHSVSAGVTDTFNLRFIFWRLATLWREPEMCVSLWFYILIPIKEDDWRGGMRYF